MTDHKVTVTITDDMLTILRELSAAWAGDLYDADGPQDEPECGWISEEQLVGFGRGEITLDKLDALLWIESRNRDDSVSWRITDTGMDYLNKRDGKVRVPEITVGMRDVLRAAHDAFQVDEENGRAVCGYRPVAYYLRRELDIALLPKLEAARLMQREKLATVSAAMRSIDAADVSDTNHYETCWRLTDAGLDYVNANPDHITEPDKKAELTPDMFTILRSAAQMWRKDQDSDFNLMSSVWGYMSSDWYTNFEGVLEKALGALEALGFMEDDGTDTWRITESGRNYLAVHDAPTPAPTLTPAMQQILRDAAIGTRRDGVKATREMSLTWHPEAYYSAGDDEMFVALAALSKLGYMESDDAHIWRITQSGFEAATRLDADRALDEIVEQEQETQPSHYAKLDIGIRVRVNSIVTSPLGLPEKIHARLSEINERASAETNEKINTCIRDMLASGEDLGPFVYDIAPPVRDPNAVTPVTSGGGLPSGFPVEIESLSKGQMPRQGVVVSRRLSNDITGTDGYLVLTAPYIESHVPELSWISSRYVWPAELEDLPESLQRLSRTMRPPADTGAAGPSPYDTSMDASMHEPDTEDADDIIADNLRRCIGFAVDQITLITEMGLSHSQKDGALKVLARWLDKVVTHSKASISLDQIPF